MRLGQVRVQGCVRDLLLDVGRFDSSKSSFVIVGAGGQCGERSKPPERCPHLNREDGAVLGEVAGKPLFQTLPARFGGHDDGVCCVYTHRQESEERFRLALFQALQTICPTRGHADTLHPVRRVAPRRDHATDGTAGEQGLQVAPEGVLLDQVFCREPGLPFRREEQGSVPRLIIVELIEQDDRSAVERRAESTQERDQLLWPRRFLQVQDLAVFRRKCFPQAVTARLSRPLLPVIAPDVEINGKEGARFRFGP